MASTGKKGKKSKGTVISLESFLKSGDNPSGTVTKKLRNVNCENSDEENNTMPIVVQLPTAPRTNRVFEDHRIPTKPPYAAYITNLPFDVNEDDISALFGSLQVLSVRLPREDGDSGRIRGFGYVELETREDLVQMLSLPELSVKGRRVRIELSNENDQQNSRRGNNRNRFDGLSSNSEIRNSTNWRNDSINSVTPSDGNSSSWRSRQRDTANDRFAERPTDRFGDRQNDRYGDKQNDRYGDRQNDRYGDRQSDRYGDRQNDRFNERQNDRIENFPSQDRPKLNLKPRTLPLPVITVDTKNSEDIQNKRDNTEEGIEQLPSEELNDKFSKMQMHTNKDNANTVMSWRRKDEPTKTYDQQKEKFPSENEEKPVKAISRSSEIKQVESSSACKVLDRDMPIEGAKSCLNQNKDDAIFANKFSGLDAEDSD